MNPGPLVLIPVNRLDRAKGRLAEVLAPSEREALATATLRTVLGAVDSAQLPVALLTADQRVAAAAGLVGRIIIEDPVLHGLNAQLDAAIAVLPASLGGLLILHADLPLASGEALRQLLAKAPPAPSVTLVASRDGGTNAQLLRPPGRYALRYGPASFAAHCTAARSAGMTVSVVASEALALDLDTPDDLVALLASEAGRASAAGQLLAATGKTFSA